MMKTIKKLRRERLSSAILMLIGFIVMIIIPEDCTGGVLFVMIGFFNWVSTEIDAIKFKRECGR